MGYNFLVNKGIKTAGIINIFGTIGKLIPLVLFVLIISIVLNASSITDDFWGQSPQTVKSLGPLKDQITNPLLVTLWVFVGVEGAVVLSGNARNSKDVGKATLIGFFLSLVIYIALSILPYGIASQAELAKFPTPSTASVLKIVAG